MKTADKPIQTTPPIPRPGSLMELKASIRAGYRTFNLNHDRPAEDLSWTAQRKANLRKI